MEAPQPVGCACGRLAQKFGENLASYNLGSGFVEAGGDPLLASPVVGFAHELTQVPLPFQDFFAFREYADQTKWIDARKWQLCETDFHELRRIGRAHGWNDFTATDRIGGYSPRNGIPIDKCKRDA